MADDAGIVLSALYRLKNMTGKCVLGHVFDRIRCQVDTQHHAIGGYPEISLPAADLDPQSLLVEISIDLHSTFPVAFEFPRVVISRVIPAHWRLPMTRSPPGLSRPTAGAP